MLHSTLRLTALVLALCLVATSNGTPPPRTPVVTKPATTDPTKVAILTLGDRAIGDTIGLHIRAEWLADAAAKLRHEAPAIVVLKLYSGGAFGEEAIRLARTIEEDFEPHFRTIMWVNDAVLAGAVLPAWTTDEMFVTPGSHLGVATDGGIVIPRPVKGTRKPLDEWLEEFDRISAAGKRPPQILRTMAIAKGLSITRDADGKVLTWGKASDDGELVLPEGLSLAFRAAELVRYGLASGIAESREDLLAQIGVTEIEWVGQAVQDELSALAQAASEREEEFHRLHRIARAGVKTSDDATSRSAREALDTMKQMATNDPAMRYLGGLDDGWFGPYSPWDADWMAALEAELSKK